MVASKPEKDGTGCTRAPICPTKTLDHGPILQVGFWRDVTPCLECLAGILLGFSKSSCLKNRDGWEASWYLATANFQLRCILSLERQSSCLVVSQFCPLACLSSVSSCLSSRKAEMNVSFQSPFLDLKPGVWVCLLSPSPSCRGPDRCPRRVSLPTRERVTCLPCQHAEEVSKKYFC